jgi:hypothetical protein
MMQLYLAVIQDYCRNLSTLTSQRRAKLHNIPGSPGLPISKMWCLLVSEFCKVVSTGIVRSRCMLSSKACWNQWKAFQCYHPYTSRTHWPSVGELHDHGVGSCSVTPGCSIIHELNTWWYQLSNWANIRQNSWRKRVRKESMIVHGVHLWTVLAYLRSGAGFWVLVIWYTPFINAM